MALEREVRTLIQGKLDRIMPAIGYPSVHEVQEGCPSLRMVPGKGVFLFFKFQEELYSLRASKGLADESVMRDSVTKALGTGASAMKALGFSNSVTSSIDDIGRNITITGKNIGSASINATHIGSAAITASNIGTSIITATHIGSNVITASEIASNAITADEIASNAVIAGKINANAVTAATIASNAVTAGKINTNAVTTGTIAASAITTGKIADGAITAAKIGNLEITAGKIANLTITAAQIANLTIGNTQITANSLNASQKLVAASITASEIAAETITGAKIAADTITATQIAADTITASQIASGTITASQIASGTITATQITSGTITATQIASDAITAAKIATDAVTADAIQANAVTASEINVGTLSAISANMGSVTAGDVNIGSGKFILESDGDATFSSGRFFFHQDGDFYIKPKYGENEGSATRRGLIFAEPQASDGSWTNYWMMWHFNDNEFNLAYDGTPKFELTTAGVGKFASGIAFNGDTYTMLYDSGHIEVNLGGGGGDGNSIFPKDHAESTTDGYDLGKSTQKWRKIWVVQSNVGDLTMTNSDETAKWTLREQSDCILARNNITKKTFKLDMTETSDYADESWEDI